VFKLVPALNQLLNVVASMEMSSTLMVLQRITLVVPWVALAAVKTCAFQLPSNQPQAL